LTIWHCILSAELIKTHSFFGDFAHWAVSVSTCNEGVYPLFDCTRLERLFAKLSAIPTFSSQIGLTKLCYSYVELTVAGIDPRTFRLQGDSLPTEI